MFTSIALAFSHAFNLQDLDTVKTLLDMKYRDLLIMAVDKEPVERGVGSVFSDMLQ